MAELYQLPDGWEWKKLADTGKISTGKTPPKVNKEFYENGTIRFVKPPNLQNSSDVTKTKSDEFITEDGAKKSILLPKNTLMVCCIGSLGKFALSTESVITNQQINSIVFNNEIIHYKYGYYYGFMLEKLLNEVANEAVVKIVNKTTYSNLDIPLPPLEEQKRIVSKLDTLFEKIDKAISLHQKNIDEANVFMASVLNDVFVELEEKYGLIEVGKVTDCIVPQRNKPKQFIGNIPWITTDDLKLFKRISQSTKGLGLRREDIEEVKSKTFPKESVLMSCVGDLGIVAIADDEIVVNQQLHTYQCNDNLINTFLMYALFVKKDFMYKIANITTVAYMNKSKCNSIPISIPPLQTQQKVVAYLDEISQKLEKIKQLQKEKMAHLKALKASILDRAFRGEL